MIISGLMRTRFSITGMTRFNSTSSGSALAPGRVDSPLEEVDGADTFYLLTDGYPTEGKIIEPKNIVEAIRKINDIRQVKINTIAIGSPGVDKADPASLDVNIKFLEQLAEITGGTFVDKTK